MFVLTINIPYYPSAYLFNTLTEAEEYVVRNDVEADVKWWANTGADTFYTISEVLVGKSFEATDDTDSEPVEKNLSKGE